MNTSTDKIQQQGKIKFSDVKRVWSILPSEKKTQAITLLLLMVLGMLLEMMGVGFVLPIMAIITDEELPTKYPIITNLLESLGNPSRKSVMMGAVLLLVVVYCLKNLYLAILAWIQTKFVYSTQADMANSLFMNYLYRPYTFHLQRNSAELINNLQIELNLFIAYVLSPGMLLIAETMVITGLVGLLLYFEPIGSITVFSIFVLAAGVYQWLSKQRITAWGKERQLQENLRMKHAQQGIGAIKDVKLYGKETYFLEQYAQRSEKSLKMTQHNVFLQNLTRLWLEILAIIGLSLLFISMLLQGKVVNEILPVLGLFAAVSFRLLPSMSRIISSVNHLRFGDAVIQLMQSEFSESEQNEGVTDTDTKLPFHHQIALEDVSYTYPSSNKSALIGINLIIQKGDMVGFVGETGAGKSTLIDVLIGILIPQKGDVKVDGVSVLTSLRSWQNIIGYVPQAVYLSDDTLRKNIAFGLADDEIDEVSVERAIKAAQLEETVRNMSEGLNTVLGERGVRLSGGQRQRIALARALYHDPDILVLDEATSALDNETEKNVMEAIETLHGKKTILIIAHRLSTVEKCDHLYRLESGMLISTNQSD